jgi:hypothetical protein
VSAKYASPSEPDVLIPLNSRLEPPGRLAVIHLAMPGEKGTTATKSLRHSFASKQRSFPPPRRTQSPRRRSFPPPRRTQSPRRRSFPPPHQTQSRRRGSCQHRAHRPRLPISVSSDVDSPDSLRTLPPPWIEWVARNLMRGVAEADIVAELVGRG